MSPSMVNEPRRALRARAVGFFLSCLIFVGFGGRAAATTIITRTPERVVMAADSTLSVAADRKSSIYRSTCKVFEAGNSVFAVAGFTQDNDNGFSVPRIVDRELRKGNDLAPLENALTLALQDEVLKFKERYPATSRARMVGDRATSILVGTISSGAPMVAEVIFGFAEPGGNLQISSRSLRCPGDCQSDRPAIVKAGRTEEIDRYLTTHKLSGSVDEARYLVQLEIDLDNPEVAGPIDLVTLTSSGIQWIQRKQGCTGKVTDPPQR